MSECNSQREPSQPAIDVYDSHHTFFVLVDLPGVSDDNLRLGAIGNTLTIEATRSERRSYRRPIALPGAFRIEEVDASLSCGLLRIRLPKQAPGGRCIGIEGSDRSD